MEYNVHSHHDLEHCCCYLCYYYYQSSGGDSSSSSTAAAAVTTIEKIITATSTNSNLHFLLYILKFTLCWYSYISDYHCYRKGVNVIFVHTFVSCFIWTSLVLGSARARTACLSQVEEVLETHSP